MKETLETLTFLMALIVPITGGLWFIWKHRLSTVQENYQILAKRWTNEGSIGPVESMFIDLNLTLKHGELYGSISSPELGRDYNVNVIPGWFSSKLVIGESFGRGTALQAIVRVKITGNKNRLQWLPISVPSRYKLPQQTELWPY